MQSPLSHRRSTVVYASRVLPSLLVSLLGTALLGAVVLPLLRRWLPGILPPGTSAPVLAALLVGALVWTLCIRSITVTVSDEVVEVSRPGRRTVSVRRADASFGSQATEQSIDGFRGGSSRRLIVTHVEGSQTEFNLGNFSPQAFRELLAHLAPPRRSLEGEGHTVAHGAEGMFHVDISTPHRAARKLASSAAVLAAFTLASGATIVVTVPDGGDLLFASLLVGGLAVLALLITAILCLRHARRFPGSVTVGASGIQVDDERFPLDCLTRVWVTVPFRRSKCIILALADGRVTSFPLEGGAVHLEEPYIDLVEALVRITAHRPALFAFALE